MKSQRNQAGIAQNSDETKLQKQTGGNRSLGRSLLLLVARSWPFSRGTYESCSTRPLVSRLDAMLVTHKIISEDRN